ncbi:hypothetical protein PRZ48_010221 [Zasmidium cellare]|uniref:Uncharacterized protein n=1 Tax=Zasmidium cellare TaxID=395010 RepID=A0ABR0EF57_ZASCE|nr:hypothetical protein PRZ48_010221 [Zasmidium cellare]
MGDPFSTHPHLPFQNGMINALRRQQGFLDEEQDLLRQQRELVQKKQALNQRIIDELDKDQSADMTPRRHPYPMSQQPVTQPVRRDEEANASRAPDNTHRVFFGGQAPQVSRNQVSENQAGLGTVQKMAVSPLAMPGSIRDPPQIVTQAHGLNGQQGGGVKVNTAGTGPPKKCHLAGHPTHQTASKRTASIAFNNSAALNTPIALNTPTAKSVTSIKPQPVQQKDYTTYNEKYPTLALCGKDVVELACYFCMGNHFRDIRGVLQPIQGVRGMHLHIDVGHREEEAHDDTPRDYEWVVRNCVDKRLSEVDLEAVEKGEYAIRGVVEVSYGLAK